MIRTPVISMPSELCALSVLALFVSVWVIRTFHA